MKPDWKVAPEWAKYLAQNNSGNWFWFSEEPFFDEDYGRWYIHSGSAQRLYAGYSEIIAEKRPE